MSEQEEQDSTRVREQQARYLRAIAKAGTLTAGCKAGKVSPHTVYAWREHDDDFVLLEQQARGAFADALEQEAVRRAWHGTDRPVYQGGSLVGHVREYSDTLMQFLLKGFRPEKYRERLEHSGPDGGPIQVQDLSKRSDAELDALITELSTRTEDSARPGAS